MNLNATPSANRIHIGFFGNTNAGKSSLVNAITNQSLSIVSNQRGTTTDPVKKAMELLPLGPVIMIDTPGLDDNTTLGALRKEQANKLFHSIDIGVLVIDGTCLKQEFSTSEQQILNEFQNRNLPFLIIINKIDIISEEDLQKYKTQLSEFQNHVVFVSSKTKAGITECKEKLSHLLPNQTEQQCFIKDCLPSNAKAILVIPIDHGAPKGRIILPQQQVLRELLENGVITTVVRETELKEALQVITPNIVITDSQAFHIVSPIVPDTIYLTSFSILMARYKKNLAQAVAGAKIIDTLPNGAHILISEGCTHHRQCDDIGTVKLPAWLQSHTHKQFSFSFTSGQEFNDNLSDYDLVIHCGGCMLNDKEMEHRYRIANEQAVPITNYGIAIAHMRGILSRSIAILKDHNLL